MGTGSGTGTPITSNVYATTAELKARLGISDTTDDATLGAILEAVSRAVDNHCGRHFYQDSDTRYFTADSGTLCFTDDIVSITTLATDDGDRTYADTWAATDYDMSPDNADSRGEPYQWLETTPAGNYGFPAGLRRGVKIIGVFGYPAVPDVVNEATLLMGARYHMRRHAPFGVVGSADMGHIIVIPKLDPDVQTLLTGVVRTQARGI